MIPGVGPSVRQVFRQARALDWLEWQDPRILDFADDVCRYARGGDIIFELPPRDQYTGYQPFFRYLRRVPPPEYTDLEATARRLLYPQPDPMREEVQRLRERMTQWSGC